MNLNVNLRSLVKDVRCQGVAIKDRQCASLDEAIHKSMEDPGHVYSYNGQRWKGGNQI